MLQQFHRFYPQGSLVSELIDIDRGLYIVKVSAQQQGLVLGTGLAAADTVEVAEDQARDRALKVLNYDLTAPQIPNQPSISTSVEAILAANSEPVPIPEAPKIPKSTTQAEVAPIYSAPEPVIESPSVLASTTESRPPIPEPEPFVAAVATTAINPEIQTNIFDQPLNSPESTQPETTSSDVFEQPTVPLEVITPPETATSAVVDFDFNEIKHRIDLEMKRLNWTKEQGRDYLLSTYGKRSRLHLTDEELLEFLGHIENLPA